MKQKLAPASDVFAAQEAVRAVFTGNLDIVRARVAAAPGGIALLSADVPLTPPEDIGLGTFDTVGLKGMHEKGHALNAAMYWAAFSGHRDIVGYFLASGDYCQKTLDASLFGAVCAGDIGMIQDLVKAGADPLADNGRLLERSALRKDTAIIDYLTEARSAYALAAGIHLRHENFSRALDMLDHNIDVTEAIDAIANKLTDRTALVPPDAHARYLDFFETLLAYAEAKGADMNALVSRTVDSGIRHWSSPLFERLVDHAAFNAHPDRQKLLDKIAERTLLSSNPFYATGYAGYGEFARKLIKAGANPDVMLAAGVTAGNYMICSSVLGAGADPRRGRPPIIDRFREKAKESIEADTLVKLSGIMIQMSAENETKLLSEFHEGRSAGDALRQVDEKSGRTGFMLAAQSGALAAELDRLVRGGDFLQAADAQAQDGRGTTLGQFAYERGEGHLFYRRELFRSRADFAAFHALLPAPLRDEQAQNHAQVMAAFDSLEGREALSRKMLHSKNRWKM